MIDVTLRLASATLGGMNEVTRILSAIERGDLQASAELLPLVYDELRQLAAARLAQEKPGQTLDGTALVHEAYLRLVRGEQRFQGRGHFFAAAAEAMRRILIERVRAKRRHKRGGGALAVELSDNLPIAEERIDEMLGVHEALDALEKHDAQAAALVKLRYFAGFEHQEAADMLGVSRRVADRLWLLARTWLFQELREPEK